MAKRSGTMEDMDKLTFILVFSETNRSFLFEAWLMPLLVFDI
jgi:hypothetical protein